MKTKIKFISAVACLGLLTASQGFAAPNAGFSETGFIQDASLNAGGAPNAGGSITVNGKRMIIPDNSIVQMPAAAFTWADLFNSAAWAPVYGPDVTPNPITAGTAQPLPPAGVMGLALNDPLVNHFPSYQVTAVGNIVVNPRVNSVQNYIVGLIVPAEQQGLNNHSGYINYIDYTSGRFRMGGTINDVNCNPALAYGGPTCSGTLVEINDPIGRWGKKHSPDQRFSSDTSNPTITAATGYPVCIPRTTNAAAGAGDPFCPDTNRPLNVAPGTANQPLDPFIAIGRPLKAFTMPVVAAGNPTNITPDPWQMVPLKVGDWVDVAGTIFKINPALVAGGNAPTNQYISAHTLTANLGIKTTPNTKPAYVRVEGLIFGVGDGAGGPTVTAGVPAAPIGQETSTRIQFVMFTTDADASAAALLANCADSPSPLLPSVALFGVDTSNANGNGVDALVAFPGGTTLAQAAATVGGPNFGKNSDLCMDNSLVGRIRWQVAKRSKPPVAGQLDNAAGTGKFYREYIVKLTGPGRGQVTTPDSTGTGGLVAGQYRFPMFEYIFGEGLPFGQPTPPFNFNDFGFLFTGATALTPFPAFQ